MSLPLHKRYEIVFLANHIYGPRFGPEKIAKIVSCNRKTVTRWLERWQETKNLSDRPRSGDPRATDAEQDQRIVNMALADMDTTSKTIQLELQNSRVNMNDRTVRARLKNADLKYSKPLSKPLLSDHRRQQRLLWAKSMENRDWSRVIFTDETSGARVWAYDHSFSSSISGKNFIDNDQSKSEERYVLGLISTSVTVDVLCEDIQGKAQFYQLSIDAVHEQIKQEFQSNRQATQADNERRYEEAKERLSVELKGMKRHLEERMEKRMDALQHDVQENSKQIFILVQTAQAQSLQAVTEAKQATELSQQSLKQATQAADSIQFLVNWAEQQQQKYQVGIEHCEAQKQSCERALLDMQTRIERDCERTGEALFESAAHAKKSAQMARQSASTTVDVQRTTQNQLELQRKETKSIIAEAKTARQQTEQAVAQARQAEEHARRATNAFSTALEKVNGIHHKIEQALGQIDK